MRFRCLQVHADDAAFSAGLALDRIHADSKELWTLFSRSRWAWGRSVSGECTEERQREDREFAALVGATSHNVGLTDASMTIAARSRPRRVMAALRTFLKQCRQECDVLMLPLGISTHPDHVLAGETLAALCRESSPAPFCLFYEDLPYAVHHPPDQAPDAVRRCGFEPLPLDVKGPMARKLELISPYRSQIIPVILRDLDRTAGRERIFYGSGPDGVEPPIRALGL